MKISKRKPFEGKPIINTPTVLGCAPKKEFLLRLCAIGKRPINFFVEGLPEGMALCDGIIRGKAEKGEYSLTVTAENSLGKTVKNVKLQVFEGAVQRTPLMGFTSWNAYGTTVSHKDIVNTARFLIDSGLADYGYGYVNLDSSWQDSYGGEFDAIQPDKIRFPNMKETVDEVHSLGLKSGIYSTPFVCAWGCPDDKKEIPGCTQLPRDPEFSAEIFPIGQVRKEKNNVRQWSAWGIDYLKYDWAPTDKINAGLMREALNESERDFVYCVTVGAMLSDTRFYRENVNSWRSNHDTDGTWEKEKEVFQTYIPWQNYVGNGHWFDLDMLSIGDGGLYPCKMTDDEKIFQYSARALLSSPIQLGCPLHMATDFEMDIYSNEEIISVNQDGKLSPAILKLENEGLYIYEKELEEGRAIGFFNTADEAKSIEYSIGKKCLLRNLWIKENMGETDTVKERIEPHSVLILKAMPNEN